MTYQQLYDYLEENNIPLMLSFSAPSAIAGPLGNTMDRGVGYTPTASTSSCSAAWKWCWPMATSTAPAWAG